MYRNPLPHSISHVEQGYKGQEFMDDVERQELKPQEQPQIVVVKQPKSMGIAYALLLFLGSFGLHRFYLDRVGSGVAQLLLNIVGWLTVWFVIGFIPLAILWIWLLVDLFLTASMVREANRTVTAAER
jgi:TM2 domain-containing membrane protein YozV